MWRHLTNDASAFSLSSSLRLFSSSLNKLCWLGLLQLHSFWLDALWFSTFWLCSLGLDVLWFGSLRLDTFSFGTVPSFGSSSLWLDSLGLISFWFDFLWLSSFWFGRLSLSCSSHWSDVFWFSSLRLGAFWVWVVGLVDENGCCLSLRLRCSSLCFWRQTKIYTSHMYISFIIDYSRGTSAHAQKASEGGRGLQEEAWKFTNSPTIQHSKIEFWD